MLNKDNLYFLMSKVDKSVDDLLLTIKNQEVEINKLQEQNSQLKSQYHKILTEVEQYVIELEQIKKSLCQ